MMVSWEAMPERFGGKLVAVVVGGLAAAGVLVWLCVRFGTAYSRGGGAGNLAGLLVCVLSLAAGISLARRMLK